MNGKQMSHRGRDHPVLAGDRPGTHSSPDWRRLVFPSPQNTCPGGVWLPGAPPPAGPSPRSGSLTLEEVWPAGGAVATVSSGGRIPEAGEPGVPHPAPRSRMSEGEARQGEGSPQAGAVTVSDIQELIRRKEEIEAQIKANYDVLESQKGVGMNEPLVDCEGYPRSDVDLYQVRTARHNIVCLQNDHKAVMKQVEEALHQLHARDKEKQARDMAEAHEEAMSRNLGQSEDRRPPQAFAKVNSISPGSPASIAGLQVDDEIVEFGSVNTQNFQSLHNISNVVQHSEGKPLNVTVIRRGEKHQLRLVPTRWAGKGLLGCNIIPLQR